MKDTIVIALFVIVALFAFAMQAFGGPEEDAKAAIAIALAQQKKPAKQPTYYELSAKAATEKKSFVRFVNCEARDVPGCVSVSVAEYNGNSKPRIIVSPVGANWGGVLAYDATDADIRGVREVGRSAPFFRRLRAGEVSIADHSEDISGRLTFLKDLIPYETAKNTQTTFRRWSGVIVPTPRTALENKWIVPGNLDGVQGWSSQLFKSRNAVPSVHLVRQDPSDMNSAITWGRTYPDGSIFADVLRNDSGAVFEVRASEKRDGIWHRFTAYRNREARPAGYVPPTSGDCRSCHSVAGSSEYAGAAIPGSDGILSDPIPVLERGESVQGGYGLQL